MDSSYKKKKFIENTAVANENEMPTVENMQEQDKIRCTTITMSITLIYKNKIAKPLLVGWSKQSCGIYFMSLHKVMESIGETINWRLIEKSIRYILFFNTVFLLTLYKKYEINKHLSTAL